MSKFEWTRISQNDRDGHYQNLRSKETQSSGGNKDNQNIPKINNTNKRRLISADLEYFKNSNSDMYVKKNDVKEKLESDYDEPSWMDCVEGYDQYNKYFGDLVGGCDRECSSSKIPSCNKENNSSKSSEKCYLSKESSPQQCCAKGNTNNNKVPLNSCKESNSSFSTSKLEKQNSSICPVCKLPKGSCSNFEENQSQCNSQNQKLQSSCSSNSMEQPKCLTGERSTNVTKNPSMSSESSCSQPSCNKSGFCGKSDLFNQSANLCNKPSDQLNNICPDCGLPLCSEKNSPNKLSNCDQPKPELNGQCSLENAKKSVDKNPCNEGSQVNEQKNESNLNPCKQPPNPDESCKPPVVSKRKSEKPKSGNDSSNETPPKQTCYSHCQSSAAQTCNQSKNENKCESKTSKPCKKPLNECSSNKPWNACNKPKPVNPCNKQQNENSCQKPLNVNTCNKSKTCESDESRCSTKMCGDQNDVYQKIIQRCADMKQSSSMIDCCQPKPPTDQELCNEAYALLLKLYQRMTANSSPCERANIKPPEENKCDAVGVKVLFERSGNGEDSSNTNKSQLERSGNGEDSSNTNKSQLPSPGNDDEGTTKQPNEEPETFEVDNTNDAENNEKRESIKSEANTDEARISTSSRRRSSAGSDRRSSLEINNKCSKSKIPDNIPYLNLTINTCPQQKTTDKGGVDGQMSCDGSDRTISNSIQLSPCSQEKKPKNTELLLEFVDEIFSDLKKMIHVVHPCCAYGYCCCPPCYPPKCITEGSPPLPNGCPPQAVCPLPFCSPPKMCCQSLGPPPPYPPPASPPPASPPPACPSQSPQTTSTKILTSFPVSIQSVRSLGTCSLLIDWIIHDCSGIGGYEICVDGCTTNRYYSVHHKSAVIYGINIHRKHTIILYVIPEFVGCEAETKCDPTNEKPKMPSNWCPSVYTYFPS